MQLKLNNRMIQTSTWNSQNHLKEEGEEDRLIVKNAFPLFCVSLAPCKAQELEDREEAPGVSYIRFKKGWKASA